MADAAPALSDSMPDDAPAMRVLVVDDDPIYRETSRMFLCRYGREVTLAENGTAALAQLNGARFDITIIDMEMPDMSGLEVISRIKLLPQHHEMPIIMITSRDDAMAIDRAYELGASSFVVKPVNWALLDHYLRFVSRAARNETEARKAQADAETMSRTKDNLLAIVRHEMKTPLNAIIGFTKLAAEARESGDLQKMREHLDLVSESGRRLLASFADMSLYSDLMSGRSPCTREQTRLTWLIDDVLDAMAKDIAAIGLEIRRDGDFNRDLLLDLPLMTTALRNIVQNIVSHARDAHVMTIVCRDAEPGWVALAIRDDGAGMAEDSVAACLEPFSQADMSLARPNQGLGLGLPIAREIAHLHGGRLSLSSSPGGGTQVTFLLPQPPPGG